MIYPFLRGANSGIDPNSKPASRPMIPRISRIMSLESTSAIPRLTALSFWACP